MTMRAARFFGKVTNRGAKDLRCSPRRRCRSPKHRIVAPDKSPLQPRAAGSPDASGGPMTPKSILVPIDFSNCAEHALDYACALGEKLGSTIHLVNAIGAGLPELNVALTDAMIENLRMGAMASLEKLAKDRAPIAKFGRLVVEPGDARDAILSMPKNWSRI